MVYYLHGGVRMNIENKKYVNSSDEWLNEYNDLINYYITKKGGVNFLIKDLDYFNSEEYYEYKAKMNKDLYLLKKLAKRLSLNPNNEKEYKYITWILKQIKMFELGILPMKKVEKLKKIGLFQNEVRFDESDLKIIEERFKNIDNNVIFKEELESNIWIMKIARYFVMNYYHRKKNQVYDLNDYIDEVILSALTSVKDKENISVHQLKRNVLNSLKKMNLKNYSQQETYLLDTDLVYDNIASRVENMSDFEETLSYLDKLTANQKFVICKYCGFEYNNGKVKYTDSYKLSEIGNMLDISHQRARQLLNRGIENLRGIYQKQRIKENKKEAKEEKLPIIPAETIVAIMQYLDYYDKIFVIELFNYQKYNSYIIAKINYILKTFKDDEIVSQKENVRKYIRMLKNKEDTPSTNNKKLIIK